MIFTGYICLAESATILSVPSERFFSICLDSFEIVLGAEVFVPLLRAFPNGPYRTPFDAGTAGAICCSETPSEGVVAIWTGVGFEQKVGNHAA